MEKCEKVRPLWTYTKHEVRNFNSNVGAELDDSDGSVKTDRFRDDDELLKWVSDLTTPDSRTNTRQGMNPSSVKKVSGSWTEQEYAKIKKEWQRYKIAIQEASPLEDAVAVKRLCDRFSDLHFQLQVGRPTATQSKVARNSWVRDLTRDGDVEGNPGPCTFFLTLFLWWVTLVSASPTTSVLGWAFFVGSSSGPKRLACWNSEPGDMIELGALTMSEAVVSAGYIQVGLYLAIDGSAQPAAFTSENGAWVSFDGSRYQSVGMATLAYSSGVGMRLSQTWDGPIPVKIVGQAVVLYALIGPNGSGHGFELSYKVSPANHNAVVRRNLRQSNSGRNLFMAWWCWLIIWAVSIESVCPGGKTTWSGTILVQCDTSGTIEDKDLLDNACVTQDMGHTDGHVVEYRLGVVQTASHSHSWMIYAQESGVSDDDIVCVAPDSGYYRGTTMSCDFVHPSQVLAVGSIVANVKVNSIPAENSGSIGSQLIVRNITNMRLGMRLNCIEQGSLTSSVQLLVAVLVRPNSAGSSVGGSSDVHPIVTIGGFETGVLPLWTTPVKPFKCAGPDCPPVFTNSPVTVTTPAPTKFPTLAVPSHSPTKIPTVPPFTLTPTGEPTVYVPPTPGPTVGSAGTNLPGARWLPSVGSEELGDGTAWQRDLTMDGDVEGNPGPAQSVGGPLNDAVLSKLKPRLIAHGVVMSVPDLKRLVSNVTKRFHDQIDAADWENRLMLSRLMHVLGLDSNPFALLMDPDDDEMDSFDEAGTGDSWQMRVPFDDVMARAKQSTAAGKSRIGSKSKSKPRPEVDVQVPNVPDAVEELRTAERYATRVTRVALLMKTISSYVKWVYHRRPWARFAIAVYRKAFPAGHSPAIENMLRVWLGGSGQAAEARQLLMNPAVATLFDVERIELEAGIIFFCRFEDEVNTRVASGFEGNGGWVRDLTIDGDVEANPGPDWPSSMPEVRAMVGLREHITTPSSGAVDFNGEVATAAINMPGSGLAPRTFDISDAAPITARIISDDNTLTTPISVFPNENQLQPRYYVEVEGVGVSPQSQRLRAISTTVYPAEGRPLIASPFSQEFVQIASSTAVIKLNTNQTAVNGFASADMMNLVSNVTTPGLSMESALIKLLLMQSMVSLQPDLPRMNIVSMMAPVNDAESVFVGPGISLSTNSSPVFSEDCGGSDPVFPLRGGKGSISFHLNTVTIPPAEVQNALFVPLGLVNSQVDPQLVIALLVLSIAEWPAALYAISYLARNTGSPEIQFMQTAVLNAATVMIAGQREIHIVLPRKNVSGKPVTTQAQAAASTAVIPTFGSLATSAYAAHEEIPINWFGNNLVSVDLTHYLYSFFAGIGLAPGSLSTSTIGTFIMELVTLTNSTDELRIAWDKVAYLIVRYPAMQIANRNSEWRTSGDSTFMQTAHLCDARRVHATTSDWPLVYDPPHVVAIARTHPGALSKVLTYMAVVDGAQFTELPYGIVHTHFSYHLNLRARSFVPAFLAIFHYLGLAPSLWGLAVMGRIQSPLIVSVIRKAFASVARLNGIAGAQLAPFYANAYENMTGWKAYKSVQGTLDLFSARLLPNEIVAYETVWYNTGDTSPNTMPVLLPDVFMYAAMMKSIPREYSPFPPGYGKDSLKGMVQDSWTTMQITGVVNLWGLPLPQNDFHPVLDQQRLIPWIPDYLWNHRLVRALKAGGVGITFEAYQSGLAVPLMPGPDQYVTRRPYHGMVDGSGPRLALGSTLWQGARVDSDSAKFWPVWPVIGREFNRILLGATPGFIECWQMANSIIGPSVLTMSTAGVGLNDLFPSVGNDTASVEKLSGESSHASSGSDGYSPAAGVMATAPQIAASSTPLVRQDE
jgi:hypothetical protein